MVGVKVPLAAIESLPQFVQHILNRRVTQFEPPAVRYDVRLPAAFDTPPCIALEAQHPQLPMVRIVAAFG